MRRLEARLVEDVCALRQRDPRGALFLVVPSRLLGGRLRARLASALGGVAGLHVLTLPELEARTPVIIEARHLSTDLNIIVRAHYLTEKKVLGELGVTAAAYEEAEAAVGLSELLLRAEGAAQAKIDEEAGRIRAEFDVKRA